MHDRDSRHAWEHATGAWGSPFRPAARDVLRVGSRRWFLQTGVAGLAGLSLADVLRARAVSAEAAKRDDRSVILFWLSGGPSHLDMWDPKPDAPAEIRGPFGSIATNMPGVLQRALAAAGQHDGQADGDPLG